MKHLFTFLPKKTGTYLRIYLILTLLFSLTAYSKVIYTQVDTTVTASSSEMIKEYQIDVNKDGTEELYLKHFRISEDYQTVELYSGFNNQNNQIYIEGETPAILNIDDDISSKHTKWVNTASGSANSAIFLDTWGGVTDKYIGFKSKLKNGTHYGWVRISIPGDFSYFRITGFAYEDITDKGILAGDEGISDVSENNIDNNFQIFTAGDKLFIRNTSPSTEGIGIGIYNYLGVQILSNISGSEDTEINISRFNSGTYFIKINMGMKSIVKKIYLKK